MPAILKAAAHAAPSSRATRSCGCALAVAGLFQDWLEQHFPDRKDKILDRIRATRGGRLNDSRFGVRMSGEGNAAEMIKQIFLEPRAAGLA